MLATHRFSLAVAMLCVLTQHIHHTFEGKPATTIITGRGTLRPPCMPQVIAILHPCIQIVQHPESCQLIQNRLSAQLHALAVSKQLFSNSPLGDLLSTTQHLPELSA
jgi:hypothetical protein